MMAALQRCFPLGGIILGDVHWPEGPLVGFRWGQVTPFHHGIEHPYHRNKVCNVVSVGAARGCTSSSLSLAAHGQR
jgi:hypothetical protein